MGVVYLAEHEVLRRPAAVKVLRAELGQSPALVERFLTEARATAAIRHPGIVEVIDCGHASGKAYIVMELLEGHSLGQHLRLRGAMPLEEIVLVGRQIAAAVGAAHERGLVHRDLKPENVFLVGGDVHRVKVLDFGIAKLMGDAPGGRLTRTGTVLGTPAYMSPEQCRGTGEVDHRSDIYSLGCVLYEMACSRVPFPYAGTGELIAAHLREPPPPPRAWFADLAPPLEALILRMLAKEPADRPPSMPALIEELSHLPAAGVSAAGLPATVRLEPPPATVKLESPPATVRLEAPARPTEPPAAEPETPAPEPTPSPAKKPRRPWIHWLFLPLQIGGPAIGVIMFLRAFGGPAWQFVSAPLRSVGIISPLAPDAGATAAPRTARAPRTRSAAACELPFSHRPAHWSPRIGGETDEANRWLEGLLVCLNGVSLRAEESFDRYHSWVKDAAGPTGKEAGAGGLFRLGSLTACLDRVRPPDAPVPADLVKAASAYEEAMRALDRATSETAAYYESAGKKRKLSDERRLHRPLWTAFCDFSDADAALRRLLQSHTR
jgi:serine/threonine protein kinase